jgi:3',5'-cyclic AMP phosphodiesterase CpdA
VRTIAHISDLHFGRIDAPVAEGLVEDLKLRDPTLLVMSGDFTQRARSLQYQQAASFISRLPQPQLVVPGNHDIPLWDVFGRFLFPLNRYQKYISPDLFPEYRDDELLVLGVNTARSFTRTSGWINPPQIDYLRQRTANSSPKMLKVLVTHHPFIPPPRKPDADVLVDGEQALRQIEDCGFDLLLAGHLHLAYHDDVRAHHRSASRFALSVQAGTATSTRRRGEPNAYNWITLSHDLITVAVRAWNGNAFKESLVTRYEKSSGQWQPVVQVPVDQLAKSALHTPVPVKAELNP